MSNRFKYTAQVKKLPKAGGSFESDEKGGAFYFVSLTMYIEYVNMGNRQKRGCTFETILEFSKSELFGEVPFLRGSVISKEAEKALPNATVVTDFSSKFPKVLEQITQRFYLDSRAACLSAFGESPKDFVLNASLIDWK